ncbi:sigma-70 family RNA polymerase sigma factor [Brevibacillus borstelensis]|uniref:sigma-70 family RNA polymerase sigma factor n=1 Tax=Brevibacillus borstelensis TaxID=45462 RepID=UPI0030C382E9
MNPQALEGMSRFRQKVIRLVVYEKKSVYETAIACGCTVDKVKRVLKKWKAVSRSQKCPEQPVHQG